MIENQTTERKIIKAAEQVFIEKGLNGTKMSDIAERAGISRTTLNYYYRTKENLFYAIIEQVFDTLLPRLENLSLLEGDINSKIDTIVDIYDEMLRKNEYVPRFVLLEIQRNPNQIHDFVKQNTKAQTYLNALDIMIGKGMEVGKISKIDKPQLVSTFFGLIFTPFLLEPLLAMYREPQKESRNAFLDEHKLIVKKLMKAYFEE
ncbi:TetR/AcrR family transcriptional regulator [Paludibacter sp. 221]|uniref:TetR/AcrR family transcriptional regulator n=1 Tax=Paludibacter sp. 221 TaxID=2302939 RepID=UPI0013D32F5F|nr:TetR/AcrR family transcriptional regulator [Paludibacter sp. 221]NDV47550.1 TetR/AcrR family transcriptional regulator [Paludibacter sp. 221]